MIKVYSLFLMLLSLSSPAAESKVFGAVKALSGEVSSQGKHNSLSVGSQVYEGDTIVTGSASFASILLADGSGAFRIGPGTAIRLSLEKKKVAVLDLLKGYVLSTLKPAAASDASVRYKVKTKTVAMGVRGTTFFARADAGNKTFECVCEGKVEADWKKGKEVWESKHHENRRLFSPDSVTAYSMDLPTDHNDEEIAALKKLL